jgi:hypothetical protein
MTRCGKCKVDKKPTTPHGWTLTFPPFYYDVPLPVEKAWKCPKCGRLEFKYANS